MSNVRQRYSDPDESLTPYLLFLNTPSPLPERNRFFLLKLRDLCIQCLLPYTAALLPLPRSLQEEMEDVSLRRRMLKPCFPDLMEGLKRLNTFYGPHEHWRTYENLFHYVKNGWYYEAERNVLCCFWCGCLLPLSDTTTPTDPKLHLERSPHCLLALKQSHFIEDPPSSSSGCCSPFSDLYLCPFCKICPRSVFMKPCHHLTSCHHSQCWKKVLLLEKCIVCRERHEREVLLVNVMTVLNISRRDI